MKVVQEGVDHLVNNRGTMEMLMDLEAMDTVKMIP